METERKSEKNKTKQKKWETEKEGKNKKYTIVRQKWGNDPLGGVKYD